MGLLDKALGNASEAEAPEVAELVGPILIDGESVSHAFVIGYRDMFMMTNKRFILLDKTGMSGKKMKITSHPWKRVSSWTYCNAGKIDIDAEVYIQVQNVVGPLVIKFGKKTDLKPIIKSISEHCLSNS